MERSWTEVGLLQVGEWIRLRDGWARVEGVADTGRIATSYDEVPYASHPYPQTHPSRLAAVATLFGLRSPAVESARVLELGCAAGGNLVPMAEAFPNAAFLGVDASSRQIGDGQRLVERLGLTNLMPRPTTRLMNIYIHR